MSITLLCFALIANAEPSKATPRVVIVQTGSASNALTPAAYAALEAELQPAVNLVSGASRALRSLHITKDALRQPSAAVRLGKKLATTHVVVIETAGGKSPYVVATCVDVGSGAVLLKMRKEISGRRLGVAAVTGLAAQIKRRLSKSAAIVTQPVQGDAQEDSGPNSADKPAVLESSLDNDDDKGATPGDSTDGAVAVAGGSSAVGQSLEAAAPRSDAHRAGLRLSVGPAAIQRTATMTGTNLPPKATLPCYCGAGHDSNPLFAALALGVELYPLSLGASHDDVFSGVGVFADVVATRVGTYVGTQLTQNTVFNATAGVAWRFVFWDALTAPDLTLKGGYQDVSFPLHGSAFPGVQYLGPFAGANLTLPVEIPELALLLGANFTPFKSSGASALGQWQSGFGVGAQGGLRIEVAPGFSLAALYRLDVLNTSFSNAQVHLPSGSVVPSNIRISDTYQQISMTASVAF